MMIVRNVFVAKPGMASKLAQLVKSAGQAASFPNFRVLTDVTGEFNRVVLEYEIDSIAGFEERMKEYATNEALRDAMKGYTELYQTGSREILQVV